MRHINKLLILIIFLTSLGCKENKQEFIYGKWQSLNDAKKVIEFTRDGKYNLFEKRQPVFDASNESEMITYKYRPFKKSYNLRFYGNDKSRALSIAHIEVIDQNRIRVYYYKHLRILQSADEFYRTDNLTDGDKIINKLYKESYNKLKSN